ncbi:MAG: hypothetical protein RI907_3633 [Pseudomonadota bacterium]|jgi:hypothetical protein
METIEQAVSIEQTTDTAHPLVSPSASRPASATPASVAAPPTSARPSLVQPVVGSASVSSVSPVVKPREIFIQGVTKDGRTFRPSDWAERLAGAMSSFRPGGMGRNPIAHIGYSPYCVPTSMGNVKCVVVNEALRDLEPMAWDFVMNFAKDNELQVVEACLLPDAPRG